MGCTSSNQAATTKHTITTLPATINDDGQQLVNDQFRKWLKINRPKADEYVLNDVLLTAPPSNEVEDYKTIVGKALDLLADRHDIKSTNKLGKLVQKEIVLASPRKVAHTLDVLKQTADKLRSGNIQLEITDVQQQQQQANQDEVNVTNETTNLENKQTSVLAGEPGIALKEALEKARVLFYKGKQAAIFANPSGGYDVRILADNDESINHDGNLLRSIIVTEVKMRPKPTTTATTTAPSFVPPPPPPTAPPLKVLDENEITDDFRRSIDAALKGLEAVYQAKTSPTTTTTTAAVTQPSSEVKQKIHVEKMTKRTASPPPPLVVQYGMSNAPLPKSISKEKTNLSNDQPVTTDHTVHLAEIMRQMAEQQRVVSEQLAKETALVNEQDLSQTDIQPKLVQIVDDVNELMMDTIEATTCSEIGNPLPPVQAETVEEKVTAIQNDESHDEIERIVHEMKEHGEKFESKESLPTMTKTAKQPSSYSLGLTSPLRNEPTLTTSATLPPLTKSKLRAENRPKSFIATEESSSKDHFQIIKQMSLDELAHLTQTGLSNPNLTTSATKLGISTSSGKIEEQHLPLASSQPLTTMPTSISQIIEEHRTILEESSSTTTPVPPPIATVVTPVHTQTRVKSPVHNVTYTEIIHSESRDGEQSRHFITESHDEHPSNEDEQTTTLKVITKSEFSKDPTSGEKIMEQSVQVITVKVRNETIKTTIQQAAVPSTNNSDAAYERRPVSELVKNFEVVASSGSGGSHT